MAEGFCLGTTHVNYKKTKFNHLLWTRGYFCIKLGAFCSLLKGSKHFPFYS